MRRLSRLVLAVGIVATVLAAGQTLALGPKAGDGVPRISIFALFDRLLAAALGGERDGGHSTHPDGFMPVHRNSESDQDTGHSIDPDGLAAGSSSGSGDQDTGHSIDPDG